jgi:prepilin-type processing-associated H-X9-DG protein/prepilin-type N-terminal cleavage/methylation domain-containing protein
MKGGRISSRSLVHPSGPAQPQSQLAFSMIELLVTVALILILTTMYWGAGSPSRFAKAKVACQKNLQTLHVSMEIYAAENNGRYPDVPGARSSEEALDVLVPRYTADTSIFTCPASKDPELPMGESIKKRRISYAYFMGRRTNDTLLPLLCDRLIDTQPKNAGQVIFSPDGKGHGNNHKKSGGNFLFCDGHVETSPPQAAISIVLTQGVVLLNPKR